MQSGKNIQVNVAELAKRVGSVMWPWQLAKLGYRIDARQAAVRFALEIMNALSKRGLACAYNTSLKIPAIYVTCKGSVFVVLVKLYTRIRLSWIKRIKRVSDNITIVLVKHESINSIPLMLQAQSAGMGYVEYVVPAEEVITMAFDESKLQTTAAKVADWLIALCRQ